jgi:Cu2+-containing amine oxidase
MLSVHHQPRTEEWPAMPIDWVGFKIMPRDFLDSSPIKARQ